MNYRHAYHAGNFADVLKHAALVLALLHLRRKEKAFAVIDTHAGRGIYETGSGESKKTGEAAAGIGRLLTFSSVPGPLLRYVELVRGFGDGHYPGSPLIAARLLRAQDRLLAVEQQDEEFQRLEGELRSTANARAVHGDGYRELLRGLPPPERRGAILIDPPYERADEFTRAADALNAGIRSLLRIDLDIALQSEPRADRGPAMRATGILVVNPPFRFAEEMQKVVDFLAQALAQGGGASGKL